MSNHTFIIDGGAGRVISAIPALETFVESNPDTKIIVNYWTPLLWGNPKLQNNVFDDGTKGLFNMVKDTLISHPEPYYNNDYINQKISLSQAFDQIINGTIETKVPRLYVTSSEEKKAISDLRKFPLNRPFIGFQPFGSSVFLTEDKNDVIDETGRSLSLQTTYQYITKLSEQFNVILFVHSSLAHFFQNSSVMLTTEQVGVRHWLALIKNTQYMISIDSICQHIARSFDVRGTVILGSTNAVNVTYSDWFNVIDKGSSDKQYSPYRFANFDAYLSNTVNGSLMNFNQSESETIINNIIKHFKTSLECNDSNS